MNNIRMSVYTLMGLIDKDIPLATVTDKKSGRVFEMAWVYINMPQIVLDGVAVSQEKLSKKILTALRIPAKDVSDEYRINANVVVIREKTKDVIQPSWAYRSNGLSKGELKKLIASSELIDEAKGPIIPRFIMEVGVVKNTGVGMGRGIAVRPAGNLFSSKTAKGKGKSAKARLHR